MRTFYRSVHQVCGHVIDFVDADNATGRVYGRAEHEVGDTWIVQACCYFDRYARRDGRWYFVFRDEDFFYTADLLEHPQDAGFQRWPGPPPKHAPGMMMSRSPTWAAFWSGSTPEEISEITTQPGPRDEPARD